ncbi:peptidoglycan/xylan/chitin deacetylase (PgdA/CDA1 family) [Natrinema hispanicum]|uniref:Peptidoglycan/xylan/chitin deacetylase (PgdA/CDA1 family) n=1 Tax=Natrinema hispanicum TaxID=392421 RepID=A0A482YG77_9EURY|nr:polysaccharide deacetylase family protein [Natrinema hispanicum]RZV10812.1 peptidoglycan/xylan/chitin deacetylase (PgdA/CDA1 family) [Natrinema hispanicum]
MNRRTVLALATTGLAGCADRGNRRSLTTGDSSNDGTQSHPSSDREEPPIDKSPDSAKFPTLPDTFDDFSDLSAWSVLAGSLETGKRPGPTDAPAVKLTADDSADRVVIAREFDDPIDCTTVAPGLAAAAEGTMVPTIQLLDADSDRVDFRRGFKGSLPVMRYNFGATKIVGDPDLSAVTEIRIAVWAGDERRRLWVDDLHFVPRPDTGMVCVQFDDGFETDYTEAFPILDQYGYSATTFVNPGRIGAADRLTLQQCKRLRDAGWAVANHGYTHAHLENLPPDDQAQVIADGATWLREHGFEEGAQYFAYPFGEFDATAIDIVAENHDLAFWGGRGVYGRIANPHLCPRIGDPSAETAIDHLDRAASMGGVTTLFYHELEGELLSAFETTIDHLHELESDGDLQVGMPADIAATIPRSN